MKRILTSILLIVFFAGAVSAQQLTGTLQQVKETGEIKIGVSKGSTTEAELRKLFKETKVDAKIVLLDSAGIGFQKLEKEKIDALAADQVVLMGFALTGKNPGNYTILPNLFSYEPLALAVRRNDSDFRLIVDMAISDMCRSNEILNIYDKWVGRFIGQRLSAFEALVKLNAIPE